MNKNKQQPVREVMTVTRTEQVTPHYIRVYLSGRAETIANIANMTVGVNNKILVPPKGSKDIDLNQRANLNMRTYTHRGVDVEKQEIWIEFVVHGDESPASGWAMHAQAGDKLGLMMKPKSRALYPAADEYLLIGDATAIPVLGAILESLPNSAKGQCIIEVHGKDDEQVLTNPADLPITWLHNPQPEQGSRLAEFVNSITLPEGKRFAFVAAEFATVKAIRQYLQAAGWANNELNVSSYWKAGFAEDKSAADRSAEKQSGNSVSAYLRRLFS